MTFPIQKTDAEWKALLAEKGAEPVAYQVTRQAATERPWSGALLDEHRDGLFTCKGCGNELFLSGTKFDSGCGWPSFYEPLPGAVATTVDRKFFMTRTEVHCAACGGHLGHVFEDGPKPTGLRYCMNGVAMRFEPAAD